MGTSIFRPGLLPGASLLLILLAGCGYPEYSGFDKPRGGDASEVDGPEVDASDEALPDVPDASESGEDGGEADVQQDAPDADAAEAALCQSNEDCTTDPAGPLCDLPTGRCGACLPTQDNCPSGEYCSASTLHCEVGCTDDTDCVPPTVDGGTATNPLTCDTTLHQCTGCEADDDCPLGALCEMPVCVPGCTDVHGCSTGRSCCGDQCLDTTTDPLHCGDCTTACGAPANGQAACSGGNCAIASCSGGFADCDLEFTTGCEADTASNAAHCGGCDKPCTSTNATALCTGGVCGLGSCNLGFADCDQTPATGCEVATTSDEANCGGCGTVCAALPHATPACIGSSCEVGECDPGYADCNATMSDGCETPTATNVNNCGGCGVTCSLLHASAGCSGGACSIASCIAPYSNCDGLTDNGCEANLTSDPAHCGACPTVCSYANAAPLCTGGTCQMGACTTGYGNCDNNAANGCETTTGTDLANCGSCGNQCNGTNGVPSCTAGACGIVCNTGFGNCDGVLTNGCETSTTASLTDCGTCGNQCSSINGAATCTTGTCGIVCNTGYGDCDGTVSNGCEANLQADPAHCGSCPMACNLPHAVSACSGGNCTVGSCSTGWTNCDGQAANGCEVNTGASATNCGTCGNVCSATNGTPQCVASKCEITCDAGWGNCDSDTSDGCETATTADVAHCGACNNACPAIANGTPDCVGSVCGVGSCNTGFHESAGQCVPNVEVCGNGSDDDLDGRADCFDSDCRTHASCTGMCMDAATVACDTVLTGQNSGATGATQRIAPPAYSCTATSFPGPEYAYRINAAAGVNVFAEAYGLGGDLALLAIDVTAGAQCTASTSCAAAGNTYADTRPEAVGLTTQAGHDYFLVVDGAAAQNFRLSVQCSNAGGCFAARAVQAGQTIVGSNTTGQPNTTPNQVLKYTCVGWNNSGPEAAFVFTPTTTANYKVDLTGLSADCDLYIVNGNNCDGTCLTGLSYSANKIKQPESVTFAGTANTSYYILADGYAGAVCDFTLSVTQL